MARHEWRRRVIPSCAGQAQEAVAQLRSRGIRVTLQRDWLVFDLLLDGDEEVETAAAELLDRVWPAWRECVAE
jgi:Fe2+ or Zn2+ uptake regulation protein